MISLCIILLSNIIIYAQSPEENPTSFDLPYELNLKMNAQQPALDAYQKLWDYFEKDSSGAPIYPGEYAGEYIDENNKLVLMLTHISESIQNFYYNICENAQIIEFEHVNYSLKELSDMVNSLEPTLLQYDIVQYGVDIKENCIQISVEANDYSNLNNTISLERSLIPVHIEISEPAITTATLYGGDKIAPDQLMANFCSLGIGGTYNGTNAILTCGHGIENFDSTKYSYSEAKIPKGTVNFFRSGSLMGNVARYRFDGTGVEALGDFGIITLNNSFTQTNKVRGAGSSTFPISGYYSSVPVGTTVYKYGAKSGYSWGEVQLTNQSIQYLTAIYPVKGLTVSQMTNGTSSLPIDSGDSGGPVYIQQNGSYKISGTVSGTGSSAVPGYKLMYSSPIYYAIDAGFSIKTN